MAEPIVLSVIGELNSGLLKLLEQMEWEHAWAKLLSKTLTGKGPGISHIGSIWVNMRQRFFLLIGDAK